MKNWAEVLRHACNLTFASDHKIKVLMKKVLNYHNINFDWYQSQKEMETKSHATLQLVIEVAENQRLGTPELSYLQDIDF